MKLARLTECFYDLVAPDIPNEWDVEEVMEPLIDENDSICEAVLATFLLSGLFPILSVMISFACSPIRSSISAWNRSHVGSG